MFQKIVFKKNSHCGYCGTKFAEQKLWPRKCFVCSKDTCEDLSEYYIKRLRSADAILRDLKSCAQLSPTPSLKEPITNYFSRYDKDI
jgi:hypothetical protein